MERLMGFRKGIKRGIETKKNDNETDDVTERLNNSATAYKKYIGYDQRKTLSTCPRFHSETVCKRE